MAGQSIAIWKFTLYTSYYPIYGTMAEEKCEAVPPSPLSLYGMKFLQPRSSDCLQSKKKNNNNKLAIQLRI